MLRTTVLSILAFFALSFNAFAMDSSVNMDKSFVVAGHHSDSKSSDSKSSDSQSSDSQSSDDNSEDDKSHDSKS